MERSFSMHGIMHYALFACSSIQIRKSDFFRIKSQILLRVGRPSCDLIEIIATNGAILAKAQNAFDRVYRLRAELAL